jgi:hypothetical protein
LLSIMPIDDELEAQRKAGLPPNITEASKQVVKKNHKRGMPSASTLRNIHSKNKNRTKNKKRDLVKVEKARRAVDELLTQSTAALDALLTRRRRTK